MELIPVLDIMGKKAVAGKSGRREEYAPLKSIFSSSSNPLEIASKLPGERLYVADLDGIMKGEPDLELLVKLSQVKRLMFDIGIKNWKDVEQASGIGADMIIGTETLETLDVLRHALERFQNRIIVSVDMKDGEVIGEALNGEPTSVFRSLREIGASRLIFLDISAVGMLSGSRFSYLKDIDKKGCEVLVGGGITDLSSLEDLGIDGVLVGTALHKGLIKV